jgi:hypothetical protein
MNFTDRSQLERYYRSLSDDALEDLLDAGKASYEEGVFELIQKEVQRRNIAIPPTTTVTQSTFQNKTIEDMTREELIDLVKGMKLSENRTPLLEMDSSLRSIAPKEFQSNLNQGEGEKSEKESQDTEPVMVPLLVIEDPEQIKAITQALQEADIDFTLATTINVNEEDFGNANKVLRQLKIG